MMFNKILVIADERTPIRDYRRLAQEVFRNLDPATDVYFSQGPMDVLDHSCSKLGFGGKMCIDGTTKTEEERDRGAAPLGPIPRGERIAGAETMSGLEQVTGAEPTEPAAAMLQARWPEITRANTRLPQQEIPCLILAIRKDRPGHIRELHEALCNLEPIKGIKMILYVEHTVDADDLPVALWRGCNNLDPRRDHHLANGILGLDGTRKTKELDNFQRDWPNIIVADEATIRAVDAKWDQLGLGPFLASPSLKFKDQLYGEEAVVS
jgi:4-hydroxy-3-polyprenylbenzoate decarboxylase